MGLWRLCSAMMTNRIMLFPKRAMVYRQQTGIEIQMWATSSPGNAVRRKFEGDNVVLLKITMVGWGFTLKREQKWDCHMEPFSHRWLFYKLQIIKLFLCIQTPNLITVSITSFPCTFNFSCQNLGSFFSPSTFSQLQLSSFLGSSSSYCPDKPWSEIDSVYRHISHVCTHTYRAPFHACIFYVTLSNEAWLRLVIFICKYHLLYLPEVWVPWKFENTCCFSSQ